MHNFGEGYRELLQQQRVEWEAAHPDATLPPLQLPVVPEPEGISKSNSNSDSPSLTARADSTCMLSMLLIRDMTSAASDVYKRQVPGQLR